jgi:hypothetical protein
MAESDPVAVSQLDLFLRLDLTDPCDKELAAYGRRLAKLLLYASAEKNHFLVATLDDFLGVLYALIFAGHNSRPFDSRNSPIDVPTVVKRANDIAGGAVRTSGNWLAGFHFNSALFRIAATYHRGLKIVSGKESSDLKKGALLRLVEPSFPDWQHKCLDKIWDEVNCLKHTADGLFSSRTVSRHEASSAIAELLELFECWSTTNEH